MKRRLICLALCFVFVLSVCLTGCKEKTTEQMQQDILDQASEDTVTLTMWMVTEQPLTDAVKASVNSAVNRITTSKFNTYMVINFLTEDEYYAKVSEEILQNEDARNEFAPVKQTASAPIIYGYGDENDKTDVFKKRYPGVASHQVDIVYIAGEEMYKEYIDNGWLMALDTELSGSSKKINENISATLLKAAKVNNNTYAIPNNKAIGQYTYMLINKELAEMTSLDGIYNLGKIDGFFSDYIHYYLQDVAKLVAENDKYENYLPIAASYEDCLNLLAHYWSIDPDTYEAESDVLSVLGYRYTDPKTLSKGQTVLSFDSLFADEVFCENLVKLKGYEVDGLFGTLQDGQKAAIKFEEGDFAAYEKYLADGEYYPVIVKYPSVNVKDVYESMFGVCTYTVDLAKSMQVLTYLNTNADLRNLLQYGVEGEHYNLVEDENGDTKVVRLTDENKNILYAMDIFKTGNTFVAYPEPDMNENVWEIAKKQNLEALIDPLLNFDFAQIVKDASAVEEEEVKVGSKGYVYTYTSGYSKEVASEHEYLKKWIDKCDAAGKGVYVLHTGTLDGQNFAGKIYYYNNNIVGAKVTVTDGNGALNVNYEGTVGEGSDVTVVNFNGKKVSGNLAWNASVNNAPVVTTVSHRNADVTHDFMDTENYTVDLDVNVTKSMISDNKTVWSWIETVTATIEDEKDETKKAELQSKLYVGSFVSQIEGASSDTYVFYLPLIEKGYSVTAHPTVANGVLNVALNYQNSTSALEAGEIKYALFVLNIDVKTPIEAVELVFTMDGETIDIKSDNERVDTEKFAADPKINISGSLNTIALNYFAMINEKVNALLASCNTLADYEAMVDALHVLFAPVALYDAAYSILTDPEYFNYNNGQGIRGPYKFDEYLYKDSYNSLPESFTDFLGELDGEEFYLMLAYMTTTGDVARYDVNFAFTSVSASKTNLAVGNEDYYGYKSPYALYMDWLKKTGYEIKE